MSHEKVIPTAWLIAHCRTYTDIPFSKEIFDELEKIRTEKGEVIDPVLKENILAPQFEARYKLAKRLVIENRSTQVLELAAGLTPRGMEMSSDSNIIYVETDFPELIEEKRRMVKKFGIDHANLYLEHANALNLYEIMQACRHFDENKPLTIINEGLLRYMTFPEKTQVAKNVHMILEKFGGVWITPDISKKRSQQDTKVVGHTMRDKMNELTGINIDNNLFDGEEHAKQFFQDLGFIVERHSFMEEINSIVSPRILNIPDEKVEAMLNRAQVFVMRLKS